jgi:hypothetical protein
VFTPKEQRVKRAYWYALAAVFVAMIGGLLTFYPFATFVTLAIVGSLTSQGFELYSAHREEQLRACEATQTDS